MSPVLVAITIVIVVTTFCAIKPSDLEGNGRRKRLKVGRGLGRWEKGETHERSEPRHQHAVLSPAKVSWAGDWKGTGRSSLRAALGERTKPWNPVGLIPRACDLLHILYVHVPSNQKQMHSCDIWISVRALCLSAPQVESTCWHTMCLLRFIDAQIPCVMLPILEEIWELASVCFARVWLPPGSAASHPPPCYFYCVSWVVMEWNGWGSQEIKKKSWKSHWELKVWGTGCWSLISRLSILLCRAGEGSSWGLHPASGFESLGVLLP